MTPQNFSKLKDTIIAANPEIMELKFGCEIRLGEDTKDIFVKDIGDGSYMFRTMRWHGIIGPFQILGRPIKLADVLLAIRENYTDSKINLEHYGIQTIALWDLQNDKLDNQSEETLQFLFNLLVN